MADLLSYPALVETPYITVEIAGVTFGLYQKRGNAITFPNFVKSLNTHSNFKNKVISVANGKKE